jgi:uncharacterized membrane protein (UPF0127 family)
MTYMPDPLAPSLALEGRGCSGLPPLSRAFNGARGAWLASARRRIAVAVTLTLALATALAPRGIAAGSEECRRWRAAFAAMPERTITIESDSGPIALQVKVAETGEQQAAGFQCATPAEIDQHLILFDFGREIYTQFHMNNVSAPLDIAFVKEDGRVFAILKMDPSPTKLYGPMGPFRFALEARHGFYASRGIRQGAARFIAPAAR